MLAEYTEVDKIERLVWLCGGLVLPVFLGPIQGWQTGWYFSFVVVYLECILFCSRTHIFLILLR